MTFEFCDDEHIIGKECVVNDELNSVDDGPTFEDLAIDDTLSDLDRVTKYVKSNIPLQRVIHVKMLQETAESIGFEATIQSILPLLEPLINDIEYVVRQHVAFQFPGICRFLMRNSESEIGYCLILDRLIPLISTLMSDPQCEVRSAASDSLVEIAGLLQEEDQGQHILTIVLPLAHDDDHEQYRISAVLLYNNLAQHLGPDLCQQFCIPELISLSEDPVFRVRKSTAQSFHNVARIVGAEITKERLFPAFLRLCHDDIWGVRKACAESLIDISDSLEINFRAALLQPILETFLQDTSRWVRFAAYQILGPLLATFDKEDIDDDILLYFTNMALKADIVEGTSETVDIRYHCAYSFPAMTSICGVSNWYKLAPAFEVLSQETFWRTRRTLAYSLHEMAKLLGPEITESTLLALFDSFIHDARHDIRLGVLLNFAEFLRHIPPCIGEKYLTHLYELESFQHITKWRFRQIISLQLAPLTRNITPLAAHSIVYPLIVKLITDEVAIVRHESYHACPLLVSKVAMENELLACEIIQKFCEFADSGNFQNRQIFVYISKAFLECAQSDAMKWFHSHLAKSFFALLQDPVYNVRYLIATIAVEHKDTMTQYTSCPTNLMEYCKKCRISEDLLDQAIIQHSSENLHLSGMDSKVISVSEDLESVHRNQVVDMSTEDSKPVA